MKRKLFSVDDILASSVGAVAYGLFFVMPYAIGYGMILSTVICIAVGFLIDTIAKKIFCSHLIQSKPINKLWFTIVALMIFSLIGTACYEIFHFSIIGELSKNAFYIIAIPVGGFVLSLVEHKIRMNRIKKRYKNRKESIIVDDADIEFMRRHNGKNKEIIGEYDKELAVTAKTGTYLGQKLSTELIQKLQDGISSNKITTVINDKITNKIPDKVKTTVTDMVTDTKIVSYLGIPYAKPPVDELRWKKPEPLESSDRVYEAYVFGPSELQVDLDYNILKAHNQSEDCLYLNIWKADFVNEKENVKKSVMVYIHGGNSDMGGSAHPMWYGKRFTEENKDVIFVSINYRIGIMGFIDFSDIPGGERYPDAPNLGLYDQIAALKWIKENIAAFGGDPDNITLIGDSLGAVCICLLSVMEEAKGLFNKVVVLSSNMEFTEDDSIYQRKLGTYIAKELSASTMDDLTRVSEADLKAIIQKCSNKLCYPVRDGMLIPKNIYKAFEQGAAAGIKFIFAIPKCQFAKYIYLLGGPETDKYCNDYIADILRHTDSGNIAKVSELMNKFKAEGMSDNELKIQILENWFYRSNILLSCKKLAQADNDVYCLFWDYTSEVDKLGANNISLVTTILGNYHIAESMGFAININLTQILQKMIVNFMKSGNPSLNTDDVKGLPDIEWKPFTKDDNDILHVTEKLVSTEPNFMEETSTVFEEMIYESH